MIGYHYSPVRNMPSILKHGLLVPLKHPKLVYPLVCSEGHRNPHVSLGRTPSEAWELSGGFLLGQITTPGPQQGYYAERHALIQGWWALFQVELPANTYRAYGLELQSTRDIPSNRVEYVGSRWIP